MYPTIWTSDSAIYFDNAGDGPEIFHLLIFPNEFNINDYMFVVFFYKKKHLKQ